MNKYQMDENKNQCEIKPNLKRSLYLDFIELPCYRQCFSCRWQKCTCTRFLQELIPKSTF